MQENDYKDFDQKLRSMLSDAKMDAPGDAWDNIDARLRPQQAPSFPVWARYACAFAVAAIAAVLLITRESPVPQPQLAQVASSSIVAEGAVSPEVVSDEFKAAGDVCPEAASSQILAATGQISPAAEDAASPQISADTGHTLSAAKNVQKEAAADEPKAAGDVCPGAASPQVLAATGQISPTAEKAAEEDPFAAMEREDRIAAAKAAKKQPMALGFAGELGGSPLGMTANTMKTAKGITRSLTADNTITQTGYSSFGLPISIAFEALFPLNKTLAIATGLSYSLLTDTYESTFRQDSNHSYKGSTLHTMHYVGIPVNLQVNLVNSRVITFYAFAGGTVEYCFCDHYSFTSTDINYSCNKSVNVPQFSVGAGLGVDFKVSKTASIFIDPSARYYFQWDQPKSIRTSRPLLINAELGMRFRIPTAAASGQEI